jgi:hypothetical protein
MQTPRGDDDSSGGADGGGGETLARAARGAAAPLPAARAAAAAPRASSSSAAATAQLCHSLAAASLDDADSSAEDFYDRGSDATDSDAGTLFSEEENDDDNGSDVDSFSAEVQSEVDLCGHDVEALVALMTAQPNNSHIQRRCCDVLSHITTHDVAMQAKAGAAGAVEAVMAAMRAHPHDPRVQLHAVNVLGCFAGDVAHMQNAGCLFFGNISSASKRAVGFSATDMVAALGAILAAMRAHPGEGRVQKFACYGAAHMFTSSDDAVQGGGAKLNIRTFAHAAGAHASM